MTKFYAPTDDDKRITYACKYLEEMGYSKTEIFANADFVLLGINPENPVKYKSRPVFAGNCTGENIFDYTKSETFALENAYFTSVSAIALAVEESEKSLVNSNVLITGYGRIGKALHRHLSAITSKITVCARSDIQRLNAQLDSAQTITFDDLQHTNNYDFVFNTVAHPVFNEKELRALCDDVLLIDLASFPGGVDTHYAKALGVDFICARGLPGKYSPISSGKTVALSVDAMIKRKEVSV